MRTDCLKLISAFRNFAESHKIDLRNGQVLDSINLAKHKDR